MNACITEAELGSTAAAAGTSWFQKLVGEKNLNGAAGWLVVVLEVVAVVVVPVAEEEVVAVSLALEVELVELVVDGVVDCVVVVELVVAGVVDSVVVVVVVCVEVVVG